MVWLINEHDYGDVGHWALTVFADDHSSVAQFLSDFNAPESSQKKILDCDAVKFVC